MISAFGATKMQPGFQSLVAVLVRLNVPFLGTDSHELGEEVVASYLYRIHLYHWLENNGCRKFLA